LEQRVGVVPGIGFDIGLDVRIVIGLGVGASADTAARIMRGYIFRYDWKFSF